MAGYDPGGGGNGPGPIPPGTIVMPAGFLIPRTVELASQVLPAAGAYTAQGFSAIPAGTKRVSYWVTYTGNTATSKPKFRVEFDNGADAGGEMILDPSSIAATSAGYASANIYVETLERRRSWCIACRTGRGSSRSTYRTIPSAFACSSRNTVTRRILGRSRQRSRGLAERARDDPACAASASCGTPRTRRRVLQQVPAYRVYRPARLVGPAAQEPDREPNDYVARVLPTCHESDRHQKAAWSKGERVRRPDANTVVGHAGWCTGFDTIAYTGNCQRSDRTLSIQLQRVRGRELRLWHGPTCYSGTTAAYVE